MKMVKVNKSIGGLSVITCRHCHRKITNPGLVGMTLVCSYCDKPVNGQYHPLKATISE